MHFNNAYTAKTGSSRSNPGYRVKKSKVPKPRWITKRIIIHTSSPTRCFSTCQRVNNTRVMVTEVDVGNDAFVVDGALKSVKGRVPATCHARGIEEGLP